MADFHTGFLTTASLRPRRSSPSLEHLTDAWGAGHLAHLGGRGGKKGDHRMDRQLPAEHEGSTRRPEAPQETAYATPHEAAIRGRKGHSVCAPRTSRCAGHRDHSCSGFQGVSKHRAGDSHERARCSSEHTRSATHQGPGLQFMKTTCGSLATARGVGSEGSPRPRPSPGSCLGLLRAPR